jgi:ATP/ADP translocase
LRREDKYKAKSFIDTFVYRVGDQVGAWSYPLLTWMGLGLTGIFVVAAPLAGMVCAQFVAWPPPGSAAALANIGVRFSDLPLTQL